MDNIHTLWMYNTTALTIIYLAILFVVRRHMQRAQITSVFLLFSSVGTLIFGAIILPDNIAYGLAFLFPVALSAYFALYTFKQGDKGFSFIFLIVCAVAFYVAVGTTLGIFFNPKEVDCHTINIDGVDYVPADCLIDGGEVR